MAATTDAARILALLAEPERLRVVAALILGHSSVADIASVTGLTPREVERSLSRLAAGDLIVHDDVVGYRFAAEELKTAARLIAKERSVDDELDASAESSRVLRNFMSAGRLESIPTVRHKRLVVLDYLAQRFEPGRRYQEREVNAVLGGFHPDTASLRRYLVDEGFLARERGLYWRAGGSFEVD